MLADLQQRLAAEPYRFDFFWALRLLQAAHTSQPKIGNSFRILEDYVRLRQEPDLRFAPSTLHAYVPASGAKPGALSVNFLGLLGPNGPLPLHLTAYALDRINQRDERVGRLNAPDRTLVAFLNVLHHRVFSFFFRAWAVHQKAVDLDRPDDRRFANYIATFIGLGMPSLRGRDSVPDLAKLYFSGRLAANSTNPEGLSAILSEFFGVACEIENFSGHWITIPEDDACRLGESPNTGSLGMSCIVGSRVWQVQTKFRIRLGPMTRADLHRLLPNQPAWKRLKDWVANYLGYELLWDVQLVLRRDEVNCAQLGVGGFLGWTTWMVTSTPGTDAEDVIIDTDLN